MCIIVVKPCGVAMPDYSIFETCFNNNPDGAGFMLKRHGEKTLTIDKGYFSFNMFWNRLQSYKISDSDTIGIHFRLATSGRIDSATCHPFPITSDVKQLRVTRHKCTKAVMHNGIFGPGTKDLSDTMIFVKDILTPLRDKLDDETTKTMLLDMIQGQRLYILDAEKNIQIKMGDWEQENGVYYSNDSYKSHIWDYPTKTKDDIFIPLDSCPCCETVGNKVISKYHGLYECKECHTVFNKYGDAIL